MKKLFVGAIASLLLSLGSPAMASLVNVNTNNTFHPNNDLRCSGQCNVLSNDTGTATATLSIS